jgi:membrane protein
VQAHDVVGYAARLAYFFLFSICPLLIVLTSLLGMVSGGEQIRSELLQYFQTALPRSAYQLVASTLSEITHQSAPGKLSVGLVFTIASASSGMVAIIQGLNTAYEVREARGWLWRRIVAIELTLAVALLIISALAIFLYGDELGAFIAGNVGFKPLFETAWPFVQWPLVVTFVVLGLALIYRFAPNVPRQHWRSAFPGSAVAFLVWLVASAGLRLYLRFFNTYSTLYGSLGAVMILMLWFYFFGIAVLVGGEVNSVLEQARRD